MSVSETLYAPQIGTSQELERARTQVVTMPVYRSGALIAPDAGTYTLYKPGAGSDTTTEKLIDAQVTGLTNQVATASVTDTIIPSTIVLGEGYREEWRLTFGTLVQVFERPAAVIRKRLYPVISDLDLEGYYRELRTFKQGPDYGGTWQGFIDEAWLLIRSKLLREGHLPYLIRTPSSLREIHIHLTLHLICMDFYSGNDRVEKWLDLADRHRAQFDKAWGEAEFGMDYDHDGAQDDPSAFTAAHRPVYANGGQSTRYFPRFGMKGSW